MQPNKQNPNIFLDNIKQGYLKQTSYKNLISFDNNNTIKINKYNKNVKKNKKISIIVPTYNRLNELDQCINSILMQSYTNFEIIIIDDCSTENIKQALNDKFDNDERIKYYKNEKNSGAGYSRKHGYNKSTGDYVIFCDDDDYYIDDSYFENIIRIFEDSTINVIISNSYVRLQEKNKYEFKPLDFGNKINSHDYLKSFQIDKSKSNSTFTAVFRKDILEESKLYEMQMVNDSSIYLRSLLAKGEVYINKNIIGIYRVHTKNITFNLKAEFLIENLNEKYEIYKILKKNKIILDPDIWLKKQMILTIKYYITGTSPNYKDRKKIYNWLKLKTGFIKYDFINFEIISVKTKIKLVIKKILKLLKLTY